jgi:hypothetical protein
MKKTISLLLALVLVLYLSSTALADEATSINSSTQDGKGTTKVSYDVTQNYTVTIPADFTLSTSGTEQTVGVKDVRIANGYSLTIKMSTGNFDSTNSAYRVKLNNSYIPYTIQVGGNTQDTNDITVGTFASGTVDPDDVKLTFSTTQENIKKATESGTHTDTLTFTCSVAQTTSG